MQTPEYTMQVSNSLWLNRSFKQEYLQKIVDTPLRDKRYRCLLYTSDKRHQHKDTQEYAERRKQASRFVPCYCDEDFLTRIYVYSHNL